MASVASIRDHISNMHMEMKVIDVTDFKYEVRFDLRGCFEAALDSEFAIRDHISNMHMDI